MQRCRLGGFPSREGDFVLCQCGPTNGYVGGYMNENAAVQTRWISKSRGPMVRDWGLGGELHGQGWLGIGAKAVNSKGKTLWLAMRRRASMLDLDSGPASNPTHHWDRGAKTWVARHSGKTRQRCWRGSAHGGNDQDQGLVSVVRHGPACTQIDQRPGHLAEWGARLDQTIKGRLQAVIRGGFHVGLHGCVLRATPGDGYGEEGLCRQVADYHAD
ncbi:hypothetical protein TIFTF001_043975 [Ficus carica]|uniref:Uncharacterized protein n=1 Tax=Ficus carica TaxID=3494 RepID=A0AA87Z0N7_FICCA|nr:hypothetical protein TIFTF001_043975 [Ficus carica]